MNGIVETLNRAAATWWEWTVVSTGQGGLLLLLVLAVLAAGRSLRPGLRYGLLLVVLLKFAVPPVFGVAYGFSDLLARAFTNEPAPLVNSDLRVTVEKSPAPATPSPIVPVAPVMPPAPVLSPKAWLLLLEAAGAIAILVLIARQWLAAREFMKQGAGADEALQERFNAAVRAMKLRRAPRLCLSESVGAPQSGGILRPFVILPAWVATMPDEELDILLAHELAHIRRMDALVNSLQAAAQALLWWNPAVWWLNRRIREEREFCCDDLVLSQGIASGAAYSRTLVNVAERVSLPQSSWAMAGMADNFGAIDRRVRRALEGGHAKSRWRRYGALAALLLVAGWVLPGATDGVEQRDLIPVDTTITLRVAGGIDVVIQGDRTQQFQGPETWTGAILEGDVHIEIEDIAIAARRVEFNEDLSAITFLNAALESQDFGTIQADQVRVDPVARRLEILNGTVDETRLKATLGESAKNAAKGEWLTLPLTATESSVESGTIEPKSRALRVSTSILEVSADADILPDHEVKIAEQGENFVLLGGGVAEQWEAFEQACRQAVENGQARYIASPTVETLAEESASITIGKQVTSLENAPTNSDLLPVTTVRAAPVADTDEGGAGALSVEVEITRGYPEGSEGEGSSEEDSTRFVIAPDEMDGDWVYHVTRRDGGKAVVIVVRVVSVERDQHTSD